ncbi:uncharacterized protein LOC132277405 [Cornus florida]|uniref:uncharacterized protein LOC132277405 n=1 Tax=Cornus florida TaxID=4283 RepID=UPI00289FE806|nr:uncharacterized protein LOC132277405 [Cornus florida]
MNFKPDKSPGPDGFPARFFQTFWTIMQSEVCAAVHHFFVSDQFSQLINSEVANGRVQLSNIARKANSSICHTFFADDLLVTCKASISNARSLQGIFKTFGEASGLHVNFQKTSVIFSKAVRRRSAILDLLHCKEEKLPLKYLGIPLCSTGLKKFHYNVLMDKILKKLNTWSNNLLSVADVINHIQKLCRDFVWGSKDNLKKLHLMSWDMMCRTKLEGGLGIRKLIDLLKTSQCVLAWNFLLSKDHIWVPWFKHRDLMHLNINFSIGTGNIFNLLADQ